LREIDNRLLCVRAKTSDEYKLSFKFDLQG